MGLRVHKHLHHGRLLSIMEESCEGKAAALIWFSVRFSQNSRFRKTQGGSFARRGPPYACVSHSGLIHDFHYVHC